MPDPSTKFAFPSPAAAVEAMLEHVAPLGKERIPLHAAAGRILGEPIITDRPSPPADVSAMDGYAIRLADLTAGMLPIAGEVRIGCEPPPLPSGAALRIVTGAPVPAGADAVVRREDVEEFDEAFRIDPARASATRAGANIRRRAENAAAGAHVTSPGSQINAPIAAALAAFGLTRPLAYEQVRLAILTTGDEVIPPESLPDQWQLRDSNGPALAALFTPAPWIRLLGSRHAVDNPEAVTEAIQSLLLDADALLITGGISMGVRDFIPAALNDLGARQLFHRLPQRPGKPALGAIARDGKPILALPGNPVSVMVTARRLAVPVLRRLAGFTTPEMPPLVHLEEPAASPLALWRFVPVTLGGNDRAAPIDFRGSGDIAAVTRSDGFIEQPPHATGPGPWPYFRWML